MSLSRSPSVKSHSRSINKQSSSILSENSVKQLQFSPGQQIMYKSQTGYYIGESKNDQAVVILGNKKIAWVNPNEIQRL